MFAIVAAEAAGRILVTDVVGERSPIGLHFGEEISGEERLGFRDEAIEFGEGFVLRAEGGVDFAERFRFGFVAGRKDGDEVGFHPRQGVIDFSDRESVVYGGVGSLEAVGGAIMAIDTVHCARCVGRAALFVFGDFVFGDLTGGIGNADPGDFETFVIGVSILDLFGGIVVSVDAGSGCFGVTGTSDFEQHADVELGVGFVGEKVRVGAIEITDLVLGPVASAAGFVGGPAIVDGGFDGAGDVVGEGAIELVDAVEFGFDVGGGAWADVAFDARDACVW